MVMNAFDWVLPAAVLSWLGVLTWFDLRDREVPHIAWVAVPCLLAAVYRAWSGGWPLALLVIVVIGVSDRKNLARNVRSLAVRMAFLALPPLLFAGGSALLPGAVSIIAFWLAWEARAWGGADALTAIALSLFWPDTGLVAAILIANLLAVCVLWGVDFYRARQIRPGFHSIPGMPVLALAVLIHAIFFQ